MFKLLTKNVKILRSRDRGIEHLRQSDRNPRCYELTDQERLEKIKEWNNRNIWNDPTLSFEDQLILARPKDRYYGA
jgi:hypothetical protein